MNSTSEIRKLLKEYFAPYLRGKEYRETFEDMLNVLEQAEFEHVTSQREMIYLFFYLVLIEGFDKISNIERRLEEMKNG